MRYEYLIDQEDKYVISWINKNDDFDIQSAPKKCRINIIIASIFLLFFFFMIREALLAQLYNILFILILGVIINFITFIYVLFHITGATVIKKEKVIEISKGKYVNAVNIKYRDSNNRKKIRRIMFLANKTEKALTIQILEENKIL